MQAFYSGDKLHKFKSKEAMEAWEAWSENKQLGIDATNAKRTAARSEAKAKATPGGAPRSRLVTGVAHCVLCWWP